MADGPNRVWQNEISVKLDVLISKCKEVDGKYVEKRADVVLTLAEKNKWFLHLIPDDQRHIDAELVKVLKKME